MQPELGVNGGKRQRLRHKPAEVGWVSTPEPRTLAKQFGLYPVGNEETTEGSKRQEARSGLCVSEVVLATGWRMHWAGSRNSFKTIQN